MTDIYVENNTLRINGKTFTCAFGKAGFSTNKVEGDNCTPIGKFSIRRVFYRADKISMPTVHEDISPIPISDNMGWSDDKDDVHYNTLIQFPYEHSAEKMHRDDDVYDIVVELGYNDRPIVRGCGSAVFFHIARQGYIGTEGCIAISMPDMLAVLTVITPDTIMHIT